MGGRRPVTTNARESPGDLISIKCSLIPGNAKENANNSVTFGVLCDILSVKSAIIA